MPEGRLQRTRKVYDGATVAKAWDSALAVFDMRTVLRDEDERAMYLDGIGAERRTAEQSHWLNEYLERMGIVR